MRPRSALPYIQEVNSAILAFESSSLSLGTNLWNRLAFTEPNFMSLPVNIESGELVQIMLS